MYGIPIGSVRLRGEYPSHSPELVKYVRTEFGDETPDWLVAETLALNGKRSARGRKRLANRLGASRKLGRAPDLS